LKAQGATAIGVDLIVPASMSGHKDVATRGAAGDARPMGLAVAEAGNVVLAEWWDQEAKALLLPLLQWRLKAETDPGPTDLGFVNLTEDDDQFVRRQTLLLRVRQDDRDRAEPQFALALFAASRGEEISWDDARS